jgi:hypothetical protein
MTHNLGFTGRALARLFLAVLALFLGPSTLSAQGLLYPQFTAGGITALQTNGSPAIAGDNTNLYIAYSDATNSGYLTYGYSTDGVNFTLTQTSIFMNSDPAIAVDQYSSGKPVYIAFGGTRLDILLYELTSGSLSLIQDFTPGPVPYALRPALAVFPDTAGGDDIYLAWQGRVYDPSTDTYDGQWIDLAFSKAGSPFSPSGNSTTAVTEAYVAGSAPALTILEGIVYLTYLDSATNYAHLFLASQGSTSFSESSGSSGMVAGANYGGDPTLNGQGGYVFAGFRSYYSENNLWVVGIVDNSGLFGPNTNYNEAPTVGPGNITLTNDPSFGFVGYNYGTGTLYEAARTNFPEDGPYVWIYSSPYVNFNPYDEGGGGDGGDPCNERFCSQLP